MIVRLLEKRTRISLAISLALHLGLVIFFVGEFNHPIEPRKMKKMQTFAMKKHEEEVIHAVSLDQKQVEKRIHEIQKIKLRKKLKEIARQRYLDKRAKLASQKAKREQQKLKSLQASAEKLKKKLSKDAKKAKQELAKLKNDTTKAKQDAEALKKLTAAQKKKLAEMKKAEALMQAKKKVSDSQLKKKAESILNQQRIENRVESQILHYQTLIVEEISHHWLVPRGVDRKLACKLRITLMPSGEVISVSILLSSGDAILDRSAQSAVYKASPLPVPNDKDLFKKFETFNLTVRPENVISSV